MKANVTKLPTSTQFFGDDDNTIKMISEVSAILFNSVTTEATIHELNKSIEFYIQYATRKSGSLDNSHLYPDVITDRMITRFSEFPAENVARALRYCTKYFYEINPKILERDKAGFAIKTFVDEKSMKNANLEEQYINDPEYGLISTKPLFVAGFNAANDYMRRLRTSNGESIAILMRASLKEIEGICGIVDCYSIQTEKGLALPSIYMSVYGSKTSEKAPAGFTLIDN